MAEKQHVNLWFCGSCSVVHLTVGKLHLSFDRTEFSEFTNMVVETNYSGWPTDRPISIGDSVTLGEGDLCSSVIH